MIKRSLALALAALLIMSALSAASAESLTEPYVEHAFAVRNVKGGVAMVARNGETVFSYAYGSRDARGKQPMTTDTCFRIASVTKLVTAVGLMTLYDAGAFALDQDICELLPFRVVNTAYPNDPLTPRQLMSHTTGLNATTHPQANWEYLSLKDSSPMFKRGVRPGARYLYSNANGGMFGALIEALSGQSVNAYMQERVFAPLDINAAYNAGLLPDQSAVAAVLSQGGTTIDSIEEQIASLAEYDDTCDPANHLTVTAGSLLISAEGMLKIGNLLLNGGELNGTRLLREDTVAIMEADQNAFSGSSVTGESPYGLSLQRVTDSHGNTWYGHQGMRNGLSSDLFYQPDLGLTVAVIANGYKPLKLGSLASIASIIMDRAAETEWESPQ